MHYILRDFLAIHLILFYQVTYNISSHTAFLYVALYECSQCRKKKWKQQNQSGSLIVSSSASSLHKMHEFMITASRPRPFIEMQGFLNLLIIIFICWTRSKTSYTWVYLWHVHWRLRCAWVCCVNLLHAIVYKWCPHVCKHRHRECNRTDYEQLTVNHTSRYS